MIIINESYRIKTKLKNIKYLLFDNKLINIYKLSYAYTNKLIVSYEIIKHDYHTNNK